MGKIKSRRSLLILTVILIVTHSMVVQGDGDEIAKKPKTKHRHITRIPKPRPVFRGKEGLSIKEVLEPKINSNETKSSSSVVVSRTSSLRVTVNNSNYTIDVNHLANQTEQPQPQPQPAPPTPTIDLVPAIFENPPVATQETPSPSPSSSLSPLDPGSILNVTNSENVQYIYEPAKILPSPPPQVNSFGQTLQVAGASFEPPQAAIVQTYNGDPHQYLLSQPVLQNFQQNNQNDIVLPPAHKFYRPGSWLPMFGTVGLSAGGGGGNVAQFQLVQSTPQPVLQTVQILQVNDAQSHLNPGGVETSHPPPQPLPPSNSIPFSRPSQFVKGPPRTHFTGAGAGAGPAAGAGTGHNGLRFYGRPPYYRNSIMDMLTSYLRPYVSISEEERGPQLFFN